MKHSKLPMSTKDGTIYAADGEVIAEVRYSGVHIEYRAEEIVKACNNFERLVDALRDTTNRLQHVPNQVCDRELIYENNNLLSELDAKGGK